MLYSNPQEFFLAQKYCEFWLNMAFIWYQFWGDSILNPTLGNGYWLPLTAPNAPSRAPAVGRSPGSISLSGRWLVPIRRCFKDVQLSADVENDNSVLFRWSALCLVSRLRTRFGPLLFWLTGGGGFRRAKISYGKWLYKSSYEIVFNSQRYLRNIYTFCQRFFLQKNPYQKIPHIFFDQNLVIRIFWPSVFRFLGCYYLFFDWPWPAVQKVCFPRGCIKAVCVSQGFPWKAPLDSRVGRHVVPSFCTPRMLRSTCACPSWLWGGGCGRLALYSPTSLREGLTKVGHGRFVVSTGIWPDPERKAFTQFSAFDFWLITWIVCIFFSFFSFSPMALTLIFCWYIQGKSQ